jgi:PAS domain S-box-containing protein
MTQAVAYPSGLTRLRQLTTQLHKESDAVFGFFNCSPDLFIILDKDGMIDRFNRAWNSILGWTEEEIYNLGLSGIIHHEDLYNISMILDNVAKSEVAQFVTRCRTRCESFIAVEWRFTQWIDGRLYAVGRIVPEGCARCVEGAARFANLIGLTNDYTT